MRIMYLLFSFTVGGTERLVADICKEMILNNQEVFLYIVNDLYSGELLDSLDKRIHVELQNRPVGGEEKITTLLKIAKYVKQYRIDVVHCNSFNSPELLIISKLINSKCKIVHTIHGMGQFEGSNRINILVRNWLCDSFIGISDAVKEDMLKAGINSKKTPRVYNGIDIKRYECARVKVFDLENIRIGCVARIMPQIKGQDVLLKAIFMIKQEYPKINVVFAGGVSENQRTEYEVLIQFVHDNNLESNVHFAGNISNIPKFLNSIDICVIPSRSEGFGLALIEAMSMGIPCVASDVAGPREIITNENIGTLFASGDSDDLVKQLKYVISNYASIKNDAWKRKDIIKNKFSVESMCVRLQEIYKK